MKVLTLEGVSELKNILDTKLLNVNVQIEDIVNNVLQLMTVINSKISDVLSVKTIDIDELGYGINSGGNNISDLITDKYCLYIFYSENLGILLDCVFLTDSGHKEVKDRGLVLSIDWDETGYFIDIQDTDQTVEVNLNDLGIGEEKLVAHLDTIALIHRNMKLYCYYKDEVFIYNEKTSKKTVKGNKYKIEVRVNYGGISENKTYYVKILENEDYIELNDRVDKIEKEIDTSLPDVGDIILVNINDTSNKKVAVKPENINNYNLNDGWRVVGIVAIPSSHDVYGTGECGIIGITGTSSSFYGYYWGGISDTYLLNFYTVPSLILNSNNSEVMNSIKSFSIPALLPKMQSLTFDYKSCNYDNLVKYYYDKYTINYAPSPYYTNGSRNPNYYVTKYNNIEYTNALSDFNGKGSTEIISQLNKYSINVFYQCSLYNTPGTSEGDWYLPACGELGYVFARYDKINESINILKNKSSFSSMGSAFAKLLENSEYWTSTETDSANAIYITREGYIKYGSKSEYYRAYLPFTRLKLDNSGKFYTKDEIDTLYKKIDVSLITNEGNEHIVTVVDYKYEPKQTSGYLKETIALFGEFDV